MEPQPPTPVVEERKENVLLTFIRKKLGSINIGHLLLVLLALHLFAMSFPSGTGCSQSNSACVFDESYYVPASNALLQGVASNLEHPFFGKIWGALGIYLFGNEFFGWRIFYALIGVLSVWVFYELAFLLFSREFENKDPQNPDSNQKAKELALFAASFLGFETLFFVHTSLLLLEGPPILFALLGFLLYFKRRYYLSALSFGLSVLSKEWGIYFIGALLLYHIYATRKTALRELISGGRNLLRVVVFILITLATYALPMWAYDIIYHPNVSPVGNITNPVLNWIYYFKYQSSLVGCSGTTSWNCYPWRWILPFNIQPSGYFVTTVTVTTKAANGTILATNVFHPIDWLGLGNLVIWYSIWLIVPIIVLKVLAFRDKFTRIDAFIAFWIIATYLPWFYVSLVIHRVEYSFYFINVDPALALGIPVVINYIASDNRPLQRALLLVWLAAAIVFFVLFFPVHPLDFR